MKIYNNCIKISTIFHSSSL